MRKRQFIKLTNIILLILTTVCSCEIETYDNGKLDGYWKLCEIDSIRNGEKLKLSDKSIFWAIQAKFIVLQNNNEDREKIYLRFKHIGDSLITHSPMFYDKLNGNTIIKDDSELKIYGINNLNESFYIYQLKNNSLILKTKLLQLKFIKF